MHILSNETPAESNAQIVQKEKTLEQAWKSVPCKLIAGMWIHSLCHICSLHFHASSLLQERQQPGQGQGMSYPFAVSSRQRPRNFSDASLDGEETVGREGRKLHASQGRNLGRYLQNTTFLTKLGLNVV